MTRIACIVVAHEPRKALVLEQVVPSALAQGFDDVVVVGNWSGDCTWVGARYLCVEPLLHNTIDALVKRDVGTLATDADILAYINDDHKFAPGFCAALREVLDEPWDVLVPHRVTYHKGRAISLNNGEREGYCGGHGGVFRRHVITARPWSAHAHNRLWDVYSSFDMRLRGARFAELLAAWKLGQAEIRNAILIAFPR